jgi:hypothetical protein
MTAPSRLPCRPDRRCRRGRQGGRTCALGRRRPAARRLHRHPRRERPQGRPEKNVNAISDENVVQPSREHAEFVPASFSGSHQYRHLGLRFGTDDPPLPARRRRAGWEFLSHLPCIRPDQGPYPSNRLWPDNRAVSPLALPGARSDSLTKHRRTELRSRFRVALLTCIPAVAKGAYDAYRHC